MVDRIIDRILFFFLHIIKIEISEERNESIRQFIKFGIVGVSNTIMGYLLFSISLVLLRFFKMATHWDYIIAQTLSFVLSVLWSFYWNNRFVFTVSDNQKRNPFKALLKSYISYSFTGLFLNTVLMLAWVEWLKVSEFVAPILNVFINVPINFFINKFWAFKTQKNV